MVKDISRIILRPASDNGGLFTALTLMGSMGVLLHAALVDAHIVRYLATTLSQCAALAYALCAITTAIKGGKARAVYKGAIGTVFAIWALAECGSYATTGTRITPESAALMTETNLRETAGFFAQYFSVRSALIIAACAAVTGALSAAGHYLFAKIDKSGNARLRRGAAVCMATVVLAGLYNYHRLARLLPIDDYDSLCRFEGEPDVSPTNERYIYLTLADPATILTHICKSLGIAGRENQLWQRYQEEKGDIACEADSSRTFDIVVIIGESFIRSHSSLYGYGLRTNPSLEAEAAAGRLVCFDEMLSPANYTTPSIRNTLNLNNIASGEKWYESLYFPYIARKAGRKVYHYDNQTVSATTDKGISGMFYSPFTLEKVYKGVSDRLFEYDGDYAAYVERTLQPKEEAAPRLVIYHLMGQHFPARSRYPGTDHFRAGDVKSDVRQMSADERQAVAEYDNATLYNDSVVSAILESRADRACVAFYFSDHGEDMWDQCVPSARNVPQPEDSAWLDRQYHIPFMVWMSDRFLDEYPETARAIRAAKSRKGMLDKLGHAVIGLWKIETPAYSAEKDIFSEEYREGPRVTVEGYIFN